MEVMKKFSVSLDTEDVDIVTKQEEDGTEIGEITAKVATLDVIDKDYDIIQKKSVGKQNIIVSAWNHSSKPLFGPPPVARGVVYEEGDALIAKMKYFLGIPDSLHAFERVKSLGDITEWSIGFMPTDWEWREAVVNGGPIAVRLFKKLDVSEASPVDRGAGIDTGTIEAKHGENGISIARPSIEVAKQIDLKYEYYKRELEFAGLLD